MTNVDRWLLPDGIDEILPAEAERVEQMRQKLLGIFHRWGYELVMPPMLEFTESLLIGLGRDLDLLTFRVTDQVSGRSMGVRADITPQTARMDAHSFKKEGVNRLCYAGTVVHTRQKHALVSRTPIKMGVELYGESSLVADIEVVSVMLDSIAAAELPQVHIDLGHVGIFRALADRAGLTEELEEELFALLQRKARAELDSFVASHVADHTLAGWIKGLLDLAGGREVLDLARQRLAGAGGAVSSALAEISELAAILSRRFPTMAIGIDLSELRGYHYHTGIVFAAYAPGLGQSIAKGGRYDDIGKVFGRARPATGFDIDLVTLTRLSAADIDPPQGIYAPWCDDEMQAQAQWQAVQQLRAQGERVVCGFAGQSAAGYNCNRQLLCEHEQFVVRALASD